MSERTSQCTGECCRCFPIGYANLEDLKQVAVRHPGGEIDQVIEMIFPVGKGVHYQGADLFSCKNFDPETTLCKIYEDRPQHMCGDYPYEGGTCYWCGLTIPLKVKLLT